MHWLRLIKTFIQVNVQMSLAYRADMVVNLLINVIWLVWELFSLSIIFNNTSTLAGWGPGELVALLGVFRLVNTLMTAVIWPNTEKFNASVRDGSLDYTLIQPVNSLFLVSFARITIWRGWELLLAAGLVLTGIGMAGGQFMSLPNVVGFLCLTISGALIIYSLWVVLIGLTFWFTKFDNNVTILQALLDAGRYPVGVYPVWLRILVTFVVPIGVATTVPLQALRGELGLLEILLFFLLGLVCFAAATQFWKVAVKRYSGASA